MQGGFGVWIVAVVVVIGGVVGAVDRTPELGHRRGWESRQSDYVFASAIVGVRNSI